RWISDSAAAEARATSAGSVNAKPSPGDRSTAATVNGPAGHGTVATVQPGRVSNEPLTSVSRPERADRNTSLTPAAPGDPPSSNRSRENSRHSIGSLSNRATPSAGSPTPAFHTLGDSAAGVVTEKPVERLDGASAIGARTAAESAWRITGWLSHAISRFAS